MKIKDCALQLTISILLVVFGVLLLLDQLNVPFIDEFFTPWYLITILFCAAVLLAVAIIKKAPIHYVFSFMLAGVYLLIALPAKVPELSITKILFILPLFVGLGMILGDLTCKRSPKAMRWGLVLTICSCIILVSVLLDVWKIVIPVVVVFFGIVCVLFTIMNLNHVSKKSDNHDDAYVTPSKIKSEENQVDSEDKE